MNTNTLIVICVVVLLIITVGLNKDNNDAFYTNPGFIHSLDKINNKLKNISRCNIVKLNGKKTLLVPLTICLKTRLDLDYVTNYILQKINCKNFIFERTSYDRVEKIEEGNRINYIYDVFVFERNRVMLFKFRINVILYILPDHKKDYTTVTEVTNYPFKNYEIGFPSKDQLIPLPTEVIPTGNDVLGTRTINPILKHNIESIFINSVMIDNSTLVMHPYKTTRKTGGYNKSSLESSSVEYFNPTGYVEPAVVRNHWPKLKGEPDNVYNWPCTKIPFRWNQHGVTDPIPTPTKNCPGLTHSLDKPQNAYSDWPNVVADPSSIRSGPNYWLFDLSRGIPQFNGTVN
tara:strand:+ start:985 stop:2019 length:1035 start_codon:yes stop_codon:yes gene_type:complete